MLKLLSVLITGLLITNTYALAPSVELHEGTDYTILPISVVKSPAPRGKINVKEFFSYKCIHCKDIDRLVETGIAANKKMDFNKIQIVADGVPGLVGFAKLNATIQALKLHQLNIPVFNAVEAKLDLTNPQTLKKFLQNNNLKPAVVDQFIATYNSFSIASKVGIYKNQTADYNITGTPTFVIADKYVAKPVHPDKLIALINALVYKAQLEASHKK